MPCTFTLYIFFFFNDTATTEIYTLSLHDALPISGFSAIAQRASASAKAAGLRTVSRKSADRKSTRLNSSHLGISYAVFCLKKKKKQTKKTHCQHTHCNDNDWRLNNINNTQHID